MGFGVSQNCCEATYAPNGVECTESGTESTSSDGTLEMDYCVPVSPRGCKNCLYLNGVTPSSTITCTSCCAASTSACGELTVATQLASSLSLICVAFALSCFCCSVMFFSAEQARKGEGMSFREAYLLPIPLVQVDIDEEQGTTWDSVRENQSIPSVERDVVTATDSVPVANMHIYNAEIPTAEPTEHTHISSGGVGYTFRNSDYYYRHETQS